MFSDLTNLEKSHETASGPVWQNKTATWRGPVYWKKYCPIGTNNYIMSNTNILWLLFNGQLLTQFGWLLCFSSLQPICCCVCWWNWGGRNLCIIIAPYPNILLSFSLFFQIVRIVAYICGTAHQLLERVEALPSLTCWCSSLLEADTLTHQAP